MQELLQTGKLKSYTTLLKSIPEGLLEMLEIPGVGPKKVKSLWKELGIDSVVALERACGQGQIATLEGFGEKTQEKILQGIEYLKKQQGQFLYPFAWEVAEKIVAELKAQSKKIKEIAIAGSLRRGKEVVKDIDLLVATENPKEVMNVFVALGDVDQVLAHGETKSSVRFKGGIQADLRCVTSKEYPYALHHFTGSKEHNTAMRSLAKKKNLKMNEYGLFSGKREALVPCKSEAEIFSKLGMDFIPPELREDRGELEAALDKKIPKLLSAPDIQGVLHCHSTWSDGRASIEEMAVGAKALGLKYFGIADHSVAAHYAGGLDAKRVREQHKEIDALNQKLKGIYIFKGIEADILPDGSVDMQDILDEFDYVVASVHSTFNMPEKEMTGRMIKAISNPHVRILGHMTGRLLLSREGYPVNVTEVLDACADLGVAVEINANPRRLDLDWRHGQYAKEKGVLLIINPDAHTVQGIEDYKIGVMVARKGWLEAGDILNTKNLKEMTAWIKKKR